MMRARVPLAVALLVAALGAGGCGPTADSDAARTVATRFLAAVKSGNGTLACAQLTPDTRAQLEKEEQRRCREAVTQLKIDTGRVARVRVYMLNAMVELASGEAEFVEEGEQGWRLAAVGCSPKGGRPVDEPYDCELED
jgi:hypothetical protein